MSMQVWLSKLEKTICLDRWRAEDICVHAAWDDIRADPRTTATRCVWRQTEAAVGHLQPTPAGEEW